MIDNKKFQLVLIDVIIWLHYFCSYIQLRFKWYYWLVTLIHLLIMFDLVILFGNTIL